VKIDQPLKRNPHFPHLAGEAQRSAELLAIWVNRIGIPIEVLRKLMIEENELDERVSERNFNHWFRASQVTAKNSNSDEVGRRVVAIVEFIAKYRKVSKRIIIQANELEEFIDLYSFLPAVYRLQLRRLLYELQKELGQKYVDMFSARDWRNQFKEWKTFAFVMDRSYCIRAYSRYTMELAGLEEEQATNWHWWHRLAVGVRGRSNTSRENTLLSLRGVYADDYYTQHILRFLINAREYNLHETKRYKTLIGLLHEYDLTGEFKRLWNQATLLLQAGKQPLAQIPVPFFRPDKTLLWMLEVSAPIPQTDLALIARLATDDVESEYLADIRRQADIEYKGKNKALFIEDFAHHFSHDEKIALGLED
jgi:hypothetical protein